MKITTSYKFKIKPMPQHESFLGSYFDSFAKAVNFFANKIPQIEKDQNDVYPLIKKDKDGTRGFNEICTFCKKQYKTCKDHKPEGKGKNDRNKICKKCEQGSLIVRKSQDGKELVCGKCWNNEFSIRKILYATSKRKRSKYGDVRDAVKMDGKTEYSLAFKRANDTLKSYKKQLVRVKSNIYITERKRIEWEEVLNDIKITTKVISEWRERYKKNEKFLESLNDIEKNLVNNNVTARFIVPHHQGQRVDRYKHILFRNNQSKGKTERTIHRTIDALGKTLEKLNKRIKEAKIVFKGNIVDLQDTAVKSISDEFVELSIDGKQEQFALNIANVKTKKSKEWLLDILNRINEGELKYPLLLKENGSFYLSYPLVRELENPKIQPNTKVMGIDRGVNQIAVCSVLDNPTSKPNNIVFFSGKGLMREKIKYQLIRKKLTGTKGVNRRRGKFGRKVSRMSDLLLHNISRSIVNRAIGLKPMVIAMENLNMIQGEKRIKRGSAKKEKKVSFMLSNFTYGKLQSLIEYKALIAGVLVLFVPPEYTSQLCYKCGKSGNRDSGFFHCRSCGKKINADLNGAINIAKAGFKKINMLQ